MHPASSGSKILAFLPRAGTRRFFGFPLPVKLAALPRFFSLGFGLACLGNVLALGRFFSLVDELVCRGRAADGFLSAAGLALSLSARAGVKHCLRTLSFGVSAAALARNSLQVTPRRRALDLECPPPWLAPRQLAFPPKPWPQQPALPSYGIAALRQERLQKPT